MKHRCYLCKRDVDRFIPYKNGLASVSPFVRELELVGSDVENFLCPHCGCFDRERHLWIYLERLGLWDKFEAATILHFAPEPHIEREIQRRNPLRYVRTNFAVDKIDVTANGFPSDTFDIVICNHVLEHVIEDQKALSELFRVLRPGGFAILQAPYSPLLANSFSDPAINTEELRHRFYGQDDHVRVYGLDLLTEITAAGFDLDLKTHASTLADADAAYYGVNAAEELILCWRRGGDSNPR